MLSGIRNFKWLIISGTLAAAVIILWIWARSIIPYEQINMLKDHRIMVSYENQRVSYQFTTNPVDNWVEINSLHPHQIEAFIVNEDNRFWQHNGIKYSRTLRSVYRHFLEGERLRGESTISQQLVKNLFLTPERSFYRKLKEAIIASHMEKTLNKLEIIQVYINIIEYGEGIYGIRNAARHYFGIEPQHMTLKETVYLTSILPNPKIYSKGSLSGRLTQRDSLDIDWAVNRMMKKRRISSQVCDEILASKIRFVCALD